MTLFLLLAGLWTAPLVFGQGLVSGQYRIEVSNSGKAHTGSWNLQVSGSQITGSSDFNEGQLNSLRGSITGNRVVIERDCTPSGRGPCRQVYDGVLANGQVRGSFTGTGAAPGNVFTLTLPASALASGTYRVQAQNSGKVHNGTWTLRVTGNQIAGTSDFGEGQLNTLRGTVTGNRVVIERDCTPSYRSACRQVYEGVLSGGGARGSFSGTAAVAGAVWTMTPSGSVAPPPPAPIPTPTPVPTPPPPPPASSDLAGAWRYTAKCGNDTWTGTMQLSRGTDGKFQGKAAGKWMNADSAVVNNGVLQGADVSLDFAPVGWTSYYNWKGRMTAGKIDGQCFYYGNPGCTFTMVR